MSLFATLSGLLMLLLSTSVCATTLAELLQADKLRIKTWIEPADGIIARQQLKLQIEVATDKWFSGGTRIGHFEIKDAIVLQRETAALNSTRTEGDKTWTVQQWTVVIYPQRSGSFEIPPAPLTLSIAGDNFEPIAGQTRSQPLGFSAVEPEAMQGKDGWVATPRFEVSEHFNKALEELKPGDALKRSINISADDLPAMMLPRVPTADIPGVAIYTKPAELADKVNRGDYLAERIQEITYVFESPGKYELPTQSYHWWNLETRTAELVTLPAHSLLVGNLAGQPVDQTENPQSVAFNRSDSWIAAIIKIIAFGLLLFIASWLIRKWIAVKVGNNSSTKVQPSDSWLLAQARKACRQNNDEEAFDYLYQWMNYHGNGEGTPISARIDELDSQELTRAYKDVMQAIYSRDKSHTADTCRFIDRFTSAIKDRDKPHFSVRWNVEMKLN